MSHHERKTGLIRRKATTFGHGSGFTFWVWVAFCSIILVFSPQLVVAETNLISNPDFVASPEEDLPFGWYLFGLTTRDHVSFLSQEDAVGQHIALVEKLTPEASIGIESNKNPVQPGALYRASVSVRNEDGGNAYLYLDFRDDSGRRVSMQRKNSEATDWTPVTVEMTAPEGATQVAIILVGVSGTSGKMYFDQPRLVQLADVPTVAVIDDVDVGSRDFPTLPNPGFEEAMTGSHPPGWPTVLGDVSFGGEELSLSNERAYDGHISIRIEDKSSTRGIGLRSQPVPAEAGAMYSASTHVFRESGYAQIYLEFWDASHTRIGYRIGSIGSSQQVGEWNRIAVQDRAPEGTETLTVLLYSNAANVGLTYYDAVALNKIRDEPAADYDRTRMGEDVVDRLVRPDYERMIQSGFQPVIESRPRLHVSEGELETLRETYNGNTPKSVALRSLVQRLLSEARSYLLETSFSTAYYGGYRVTYPLPPVEPEDPMPNPPGYTPQGGYPYWLGMSRDLERRLETLALTYAISGDPQFGERAKEYVLALAEWSSWTQRSWTCRGTDVCAGADAGHLTLGVAVTYDMVYDLLTDDERETIRKALFEKGLRPLYLRSKDDVIDDNGFAVRTGVIGIAALALFGDVTEVDEYVEWAYEHTVWYLDQRLYSTQTEGVNYTGYSLEYLGRFVDALTRVTDRNDLVDHPYIHTVMPEWTAYFLAPGNRGMVNFSDSGTTSHMSKTMMYLSAIHRQNALAGSYVNSAVSPTPREYVLYGIHLYPAQSAAQLGLPPSRAFWETGWVALRSGWGSRDHLLAFQSSQSRLGHNQYDQNHFVLNVAGDWLITDPGYPDFSAGPRNQVTFHTVGHNALLVDGGGQIEKGVGTLMEFFHSPFFDFTTGEAGRGYAAHGVTGWERKIIYSRPDYFVLVDRVHGLRPVQLELLFQTSANNRMLIDGQIREIDDRVKANTFQIKGSRSSVEGAVVFPPDITLTYTHVRGAEDFGPFVKVAREEKADEAVFVTVLRPSTDSDPRSGHVDAYESDAILLLDVSMESERELMLLNPHRQSGIVGESVQSGVVQMMGDHAIIRYRSYPPGDSVDRKAIDGYHLANGRLLRDDEGTVLVQSDQNVSISVGRQDEALQAVIWTDERGIVRFFTDRPISSVTVNGVRLAENEYTFDEVQGLFVVDVVSGESVIRIE